MVALDGWGNYCPLRRAKRVGEKEEGKHFLNNFWTHYKTDSLVSLDTNCARSIVKLFSKNWVIAAVIAVS